MSLGRTLVLAAIIAVALTAFAIGKGSSSGNVVLCAADPGGDLSLASHGKCDKGDKKLKIAKRGPAGTDGTQGPPGQDGSDASVKPEAIHLVSPAGAVGSDCSASPGAFCSFTSQCNDQPWRNYEEVSGYGPVGFLKDAEGFVHLQGMAQIASSSGGGSGLCGTPAGIFFLPPGYRPTGGTLRFDGDDCYGGTATPRRLEIQPNGRVSVAGSNCVSLSGITFTP
jgi:hypothetical protein